MVAAFCIIILLCDELIIRFIRGVVSVRFIQALWSNAGRRLSNSGQDKRKNPGEEKVKQIQLCLSELYHRGWAHKVRILLITGSTTDVEKLTPGLSSQYWQEDKGTLLLWGGDLNTPPDAEWLQALHKLCRRPFDGIVWVTAAFESFPINDLSESYSAFSHNEMDAVAHALNARYLLLKWRLPLYVWSLFSHAGTQDERITQAVGCLLPAQCQGEVLTEQLKTLSSKLISQGIQQISAKPQHQFLLMLADQLNKETATVTAPLSVLLNPYRPLPLAGVIFSQPSAGAERSVRHHWGMDNRWDILPSSVRMLPSGLRPIRPGLNRQRAAAWGTAGLGALCAAWMVVSFINNRSTINQSLTQAVRASEPQLTLPDRLLALSELQKTMARLKYRAEKGVPWYNRAGLSRNDELLSALWPRYAQNALPLLRNAAAVQLESQLKHFVQLPPESSLREKMSKAMYDKLKLYLMLARPEKMDARWFTDTLIQQWPQRKGVTDSIWQGLAPSLMSFYGEQLSEHPQWRLPVEENRVSQVRALLIRLMGMRNSEATLYQKMLLQIANMYTDMQLEDMTADTDASRLFTSSQSVPGMFTRQAWEQSVQPAIENMVKQRRDEMDWVLTDNKQSAQQESSPEALKARLEARYFADFSGAWLEFLNSLRLQRVQTLSDAIDQLTLVADVRQSPLVALMNTLSVQGRTGQGSEALSDSLVKSAKNLLGNKTKGTIDQHGDAHGPLDATFGQVIGLMDNDKSGEQILNLQSWLNRVTQVRLRLQQITNATDPQAMSLALAQTVFQGKTVDLTETRDYGSLMAARLGQEWNGFGQTVFVRPMEQAWQQVLTPAAESLNVQWQQSLVGDWNQAFNGRYPFNNSSSEVSLPLLAKYLNADSGRIAQFLQMNLAGVLHREGSKWVPDSVNAQGLTFNPAFIEAINALSHISDVAFTDGRALLNFDLRPGTADGVMKTDLMVDGQRLTYVNQLPEWHRFTWPADTEAPGGALSWVSTQAGTLQYADERGSWGWIRLLEQASVNAYPGVASSYSLAWKGQDGRLLNYTLRTEVDEGPLVLLKLRHFRLPTNIFTVTATAAQTKMDESDID